MKPHALVSAVALGGTIAIVVASGCSTNQNNNDSEPDGGQGSNYSGDGGNGSDSPVPPMPTEFTVSLTPDGATGMQRVSFAVPMPAGLLKDETAIKVLA